MKKFETVKKWISDGVDSGYFMPGDKIPSESELMKRFDVSRNAVRQAVNELIREQIVESRQGIGSFVLHRYSKKSYDICFLCYRTSSYIFPKIIHGCNKIVQKSGFHLMINESWYDLDVEEKILQNLLKKGIAGLIITPVEDRNGKNNSDLLLNFEKSGIPVLLLDNYFRDREFAAVALEDIKAGSKAASFLWEYGHRDVGMVYSTDYYPKRLRFEGASDFFKSQGSGFNPEHIIELEGQGSGVGLYRQIKTVLTRKKTFPSAFICSSDDEAVMLIHSASRMGLSIPEHFSVISFDNSDISNFSHPRLTTMNHPSEYMGELSATLLINRLNYPEIRMTSKTLIDSYVVRRDSVLPFRDEKLAGR